METPAQMCVRLITALEDLVEQEAASMQNRDFAGAITVQDRAAPLVALLSAHEADVTDPAVRARVVALHARRQQTGEWLAEQIEAARAELNQTRTSQRRVAQIAPVYGRAGGGSQQFCAVG